MIEELKDITYINENGSEILRKPTQEEIIDKINEIIRKLNKVGDIE